MVAEPVMLPLKAEKFWMVYGVGQRGPAYEHRTKASARAEAKRLAALHPDVMFVVLAAVDAYRTAAPILQRFEIVKPDPAGHDVDGDIPF